MKTSRTCFCVEGARVRESPLGRPAYPESVPPRDQDFAKESPAPADLFQPMTTRLTGGRSLTNVVARIALLTLAFAPFALPADAVTIWGGGGVDYHATTITSSSASSAGSLALANPLGAGTPGSTTSNTTNRFTSLV